MHKFWLTVIVVLLGLSAAVADQFSGVITEVRMTGDRFTGIVVAKGPKKNRVFVTLELAKEVVVAKGKINFVQETKAIKRVAGERFEGGLANDIFKSAPFKERGFNADFITDSDGKVKEILIFTGQGLGKKKPPPPPPPQKPKNPDGVG